MDRHREQVSSAQLQPVIDSLLVLFDVTLINILGSAVPGLHIPLAHLSADQHLPLTLVAADDGALLAEVKLLELFLRGWSTLVLDRDGQRNQGKLLPDAMVEVVEDQDVLSGV